MTELLKVERLRELLIYERETGEFSWKVEKGRCIKPGDVAGCFNWIGYRVIMIDRRQYMAHRLAWLYVHGEWPAGDIDHINGVKADNRIANLRDVTKSVNQQNQRRAKANNRSGYLGVSRRHGRWVAQIQLEGRVRCLGFFDSPEIASEAYLKAKRMIHEGCTL